MTEDIINWFELLVKKFRKEKAKLDPELRDYISNLQDLSYPLQINGLWVRDDDQNDLFLLFFFHDLDKDDYSITINGPFSINSDEEKIMNYFLQSEYLQQIHSGAKEKLCIVYEKLLIDNLKKIKTINQEGRIHSGIFNENKENFFWMIYGIPENDYIDKLMDEMINGIAVNLSFIKNLPHQEDLLKAKGKRIPAIGGFLYPLIWVGDLPCLQEKERYKPPILQKFINPTIITKYKDRRLFITNDGFFALGYDENTSDITKFPTNKELHDSLKLLNGLLGVFLISGINVHSFDRQRLGSPLYFKKTLELIESFPAKALSEEIHKKRLEPFIESELLKERQVIPTDRITNLIKEASYLTSENILGEIPSTLLQSYTHIYNLGYSQSFLLSWAIIEQYLGFLWEKNIKEREIRGERRKILLSNRDYPASVKSQILEMVGFLDLNELENVNKARKFRNAFIHNLKSISFVDAKFCFDLCQNFLKKWIQDLISIREKI